MNRYRFESCSSLPVMGAEAESSGRDLPRLATPPWRECLVVVLALSVFPLATAAAQRPSPLAGPTFLVTGMQRSHAAGPGRCIITHRGERIEVQGGWEVQGERVIFTYPNGTLSSIRLSDVDLEASRAAHLHAPRSRSAPAPRPARPPVLVLKDGDVPSFASSEDEEEAAETLAATSDDGTAASRSAPPPRADKGPLEVISWRDVPNSEDTGLELFATLRNNHDKPVRGIEVTVHLYDETGAPISSTPAQLARTALSPSSTVNFRASFPDVVRFESVKFDVMSQ